MASLTARTLAAANAAKAWAEGPAGTRLKQGFNIALSVLILALLVRAIARVGLDEVIAVLPTTPLFWILWTAHYLLPPVTEWIIYRRWWPMSWRGLGVFVKMRVMNDALFSYSGHTYLLVWASNLLGIRFDPANPPGRLLGRGGGDGVDPATNPFAAVKDNAFTSGLAGNFSTLLWLLLALGLGGTGLLGADSPIDSRALRGLLIGFGALILLSLGIIAFRERLMSLSVVENMRAFWWHLLRVNLTHLLQIGTWIVALPMIPVATWLLLGALRMVIGRMPVPNKEVLFAALAAQLAGEASLQVAALMAAQGVLHLLFHGLAWVGASAIEPKAARKPG